MHITKKALVSIACCVAIIAIAYNYYASVRPAKLKKAGQNSQEHAIPQVTQHEARTITATSASPITVDDIALTVNSVNDSRCPQDVQCITAGTVRAEITLVKNTTKETREIGLNEASFVFEGVTFRLIAVTPKKTGEAVKDGMYVLTFSVK